MSKVDQLALIADLSIREVWLPQTVEMLDIVSYCFVFILSMIKNVNISF